MHFSIVTVGIRNAFAFDTFFIAIAQPTASTDAIALHYLAHCHCSNGPPEHVYISCSSLPNERNCIAYDDVATLHITALFVAAPYITTLHVTARHVAAPLFRAHTLNLLEKIADSSFCSSRLVCPPRHLAMARSRRQSSRPR